MSARPRLRFGGALVRAGVADRSGGGRGERGPADLGRFGFQPAPDGAVPALEHGDVLEELPAGVDGSAERIELERRLATASRTGPGRPSISTVAAAKKQPAANVPRSM
jgi:hypothetical protein